MKPYLYNSTRQDSQYTYFARPMNFSEGEQWCRDNGGHLASYTSEREQQVGGVHARQRSCSSRCIAAPLAPLQLLQLPSRQPALLHCWPLSFACMARVLPAMRQLYTLPCTSSTPHPTNSHTHP